MSVCPKCGFTYAWDGTRCGHCHYPESPISPEDERDDLLAQRILHKARTVIGRRTHPFEDLASDLQNEILQVAHDKIYGRVVLVFFDSSKRWTLLTTRELIGWEEGRLRWMPMEDMVSVGSASHPPADASTEEEGRWKATWEYLRVVNHRGKQVIAWVPCGNEAYMLWNILLPFVIAKR